MVNLILSHNTNRFLKLKLIFKDIFFITFALNYDLLTSRMRHLFSILFTFIFLNFLTINSYSQSTFVPLNDDYYHLVDRLELKRGRFSEGFHYSIRPLERKAIVQLTDSILTNPSIRLTTVDKSTLRFLREDSREWIVPGVVPDSLSEPGKPAPAPDFLRFSKHLWKHPADFYSSHSEDFDLHVNLATDNFLGSDNNTGTMRWFTARGVELRGMINNKLGFYTFVADNQGSFAKYVRDYTDRYNFPGEGLAKKLKNTGVDFMSARGYITFRPLKSINVQFGHDRNFFGSGFRSMLFSDNSSPNLFLRLDTQIGRFHYTNLWNSMINNQDDPDRDLLRKKKFSAIHHLSIKVSDRLSLGVFEAEVFSRDSSGGGFELNYLNPIIFYRYVESYIGSSDNALLGFDFRWLAARRTSVYGQILFDELLTGRMFDGKGSWTNKYGIQLGSKYVDAFGIPNLDLQLEYNSARPYLYTHRTGGKNYVHYSQPIAHPLGANFTEMIGILRYKPTPFLTLYGTMMLARQGVDSGSSNWGSHLFPDYETRMRDYGNYTGQGVRQNIVTLDLRASYMLFHNFFLEGRVMKRRETGAGAVTPHTSLFNLGLRYNIPYRQQVF